MSQVQILINYQSNHEGGRFFHEQGDLIHQFGVSLDHDPKIRLLLLLLLLSLNTLHYTSHLTLA
jgi:hypothetical protein